MNADYRIIAANAAYRREFSGGEEVTGRTCYEVSSFSVPCDQAGESRPPKRASDTGSVQRVLRTTRRG